jgi:hypothetical protein
VAVDSTRRNSRTVVRSRSSCSSCHPP